jgi:hypothetical protein
VMHLLVIADVRTQSTRMGGKRAMIHRQDANRKRRDAEPHRGDPTGGMIRRMMRNRLVVVPTEPVDETPLTVLSRWTSEMGLDIGRDALLDLARGLRECVYFEEDGHLFGEALVRSIRHQAKLIAQERWADKNTLRFLADRVEDTLRTMGLL